MWDSKVTWSDDGKMTLNVIPENVTPLQKTPAPQNSPRVKHYESFSALEFV